MLNKNKKILQTFKMKEPQIMKQDIIMNEIYINVHIHLFCKKEKNNHVNSYFTIVCVKVLLSCNTHLRSLINIRFLSEGYYRDVTYFN